MKVGAKTLWWESLRESPIARPVLAGDVRADVVIIGAGYTGLWTAYWLQERDPSLSIAIIDKHHVGFGASGRNGGWVSGLFPASRKKIAQIAGSNDKAREFVHLLRSSVTDFEQVLQQHHIDADFKRGGSITVARTALQVARAQEDVAQSHQWGDTDDDLRLLSAEQARDMLNATDVLGGTFTPHCAVIHPGKLVRALADLVEQRGATIYEQTAATSIWPNTVHTPAGTLHSRYVVRATEGYTASINGHHRRIAPIWSLMIATEPLSEQLWSEIGLAQRETFSEYRQVVVYGQRTADGRLAFGGRGAPYHFGSSTHPKFDEDPKTFAMLFDTLCDYFPALRNVAITHHWGGPLGISRDWFPSVGLDAETGFAWSGSYVGDGVTASFLGGRTLADLITGTTSHLTSQPWVNHKSPYWEQEPFRWLGINATRIGLQRADDYEFATGRTSLLGRVMQGLVHGV